MSTEYKTKLWKLRNKSIMFMFTPIPNIIYPDLEEHEILPKACEHIISRFQFAFITAHRENLDDDINEARNIELAKKVKTIGYDCLFLDGYWKQNDKTLQKKRVYETILFVMGKQERLNNFDYRREFAQRMKEMAREYEQEIVLRRSFGRKDIDENKKFVVRMKELADEFSYEDVVKEHKRFAHKMRTLAKKYDQDAVIIDDMRGTKLYAPNGRVLFDFSECGLGDAYCKLRKKENATFVFEGERECDPGTEFSKV